MKKFYIHILTALTVITAACNDTVYSDYSQSNIKSANCTPMFMPLSVSDGAVVTMQAESDTNTYSFIKIDKNAELTSSTIKFTWSYNDSHGSQQNNNSNYNDNNKDNNDNQNDDINQNDDANQEQNNDNTNENNSTKKSYTKQTSQQTVEVVDISDGKLRKNNNDEYFFDFYSSNNFGREYFAIVKFDKNCNIIFQKDSTINAMSNGNGNQNNVSKMPVAGTPLDNGGYAIIYQTPSMGMMQATSYDLTMKVLDTNGETTSSVDLEFSETVSITDVNSIDNNILITYENSSSVAAIKIFSLEGTLINTSDIINNINQINFLNYGEYGFISGYEPTTQKFTIVQIDKNGDIITQNNLDSIGIIVNVNEFNNMICLTGFTQSSNYTTYNTVNSYLNYISNLNGLIVLLDSQTNNLDYITADYGNGVIVYSAQKNSDNTYTVFLSQVTPSDLLFSEYSYGSKIYVYQVDDLKKLQIN